MDKLKLKKIADELDAAFQKYQHTNEILAIVYESIESLLKATSRLEVDSYINRDDVPGRYYWVDRGMGWPTELSILYSDFRIEISGGLGKKAEDFLARMDKEFPEGKS